ncbi:MAG TPA: N-acetylmuramic acid 6-phosphate etherase [Beutenbergiaceae bacterium]|nr:N-acetylmuramic acid 6-phosphate etherase [Beutenbergiaceae bacterium]
MVATGDLHWSTEQPNPASLDLDTRSTADIVETLLSADASVAAAVAAVGPEIAAAAELVVETFTRGGTVHYVGSGTSGRMGVLDAVELLPTFNVDDSQVRAHLAGGLQAMTLAVEGAEDDDAAGEAIAQEAGARDLIVGLTASGRTPFVRGALARATSRGIPTVLVSTNPAAPLTALAHIAILPDTGPEVLTGSTRLKAATAQKMVLNALSTAAMVRLGKAYSNLMIDMIPTNEKLHIRSVGILRQASGVSEERARAALEEAEGVVRVALVSLLAGVDATTAGEALARHRPNPHRERDPSGIRSAVRELERTLG